MDSTLSTPSSEASKSSEALNLATESVMDKHTEQTSPEDLEIEVPHSTSQHIHDDYGYTIDPELGYLKDYSTPSSNQGQEPGTREQIRTSMDYPLTRLLQQGLRLAAGALKPGTGLRLHESDGVGLLMVLDSIIARDNSIHDITDVEEENLRKAMEHNLQLGTDILPAGFGRWVLKTDILRIVKEVLYATVYEADYERNWNSLVVQALNDYLEDYKTLASSASSSCSEPSIHESETLDEIHSETGGRVSISSAQSISETDSQALPDEPTIFIPYPCCTLCGDEGDCTGAPIHEFSPYNSPEHSVNTTREQTPDPEYQKHDYVSEEIEQVNRDSDIPIERLFSRMLAECSRTSASEISLTFKRTRE